MVRPLDDPAHFVRTLVADLGDLDKDARLLIAILHSQPMRSFIERFNLSPTLWLKCEKIPDLRVREDVEEGGREATAGPFNSPPVGF